MFFCYLKHVLCVTSRVATTRIAVFRCTAKVKVSYTNILLPLHIEGEAVSSPALLHQLNRH